MKNVTFPPISVSRIIRFLSPTLPLFIFTAVFFQPMMAQALKADEVFVHSWSQGAERIADQTLQVRLTQDNKEFQTQIVTQSGSKYLLSIKQNPMVDIKGEHWKIVLNKIPLGADGKMDYCTDLLLPERPCETGGDNFPRERLSAYFYPYEEKKITLGDNMSLIEWEAFYPTKTRRKFLVDGFLSFLKAAM